MRQVGVLAAAGLVALKRTLPRLVDDHENARRLAAGVAAIPGIKVDVAGVETNIVMIEVDERVNLTAQAVVRELEKRGVLALTIGEGLCIYGYSPYHHRHPIQPWALVMTHWVWSLSQARGACAW
jgi:threonine aldolase